MPRINGKIGSFDYTLVCDQCDKNLKNEKVQGISVTSRAALAFFTHEEQPRYFCDKKCLKDWVSANIE